MARRLAGWRPAQPARRPTRPPLTHPDSQHNKRREELHRLKEKHPDLAARLEARAARTAAGDDGGSETSPSSSDSEGDDPDGVEGDVAFLDALVKLKRRDPSLYDEKTKLFDNGGDGGDSGGGGGAQAGDGPEAADDDEEKTKKK